MAGSPERGRADEFELELARQQSRAVRRRPLVLAIAEFVECYGAAFWRGWQETTDRLIPFKLFWLYHAAIPHLRATRALSDVRASGLAIGAALSGDPATRRAISDLIREAYPDGD